MNSKQRGAAIALLCFVLIYTIKAQPIINQITNGSFEDTIQCPYFPSQIDFANGWFKPTLGGSSDYFNTCSNSFTNTIPSASIITIPSNRFGFQYPRSGNAYQGLGIYSNKNPTDYNVTLERFCMPKVAQHRALARQWEILKRLPARGPGITSRELVQSLERAGFQITKRTVERDLTELSMLFGIACNDGSVPYGWYWVRGECPDLPGVTLADALSLNMIEATSRPMLPPSALEALEQRFQIARRKLTELSQDNPNARWASKVSYVQQTMPLIPPIIPEGVLEAVQEALLQERQLRISYRARGGSRATDQIVHPIGFVQRGPISYLVATAFDYDDKRLPW